MTGTSTISPSIAGPFTSLAPDPEIRKLDLFTIAGLTALLWVAIIAMTAIVL